MAKHTPGPWEAKEVKTSCGRAFKIDRIGEDNAHGLVACIYDDSTTLNAKPHEEHEANVRLIAAAPELLEALEEIYERNSSGDQSDPITQRIAKQAIDKAEGGVS